MNFWIAAIASVLLEVSVDALSGGNFSLLGPLGLFFQARLGLGPALVAMVAAWLGRVFYHLSRNEPKAALVSSIDCLCAVLATCCMGWLGWAGCPFIILFLFLIPVAMANRMGLDASGRPERYLAQAATLCLLFPAWLLRPDQIAALSCFVPVCLCLAAAAHAHPELRRAWRTQRSAERGFARERLTLEARAQAAANEVGQAMRVANTQISLRYHASHTASRMRLLLDGAAELARLNDAQILLDQLVGSVQSWTGRPCAAEFMGMRSGPPIAGACWECQLGSGSIRVDGPSPDQDESELLSFWAFLGSAALQRTVQQARWAQGSKMAAIGQLAAGLAHELNTPLGSLVLSLNMARGCLESDPERASKRLGIAGQAAEQMKGIIQQLLHYARTSGATREKVELSQIVQDSRTLVDHSFQIAGVALEGDLGPVLVFANRVELQQVLLNLLVNARQAVEKQERRWVGVRAFERGGRAFLTVEDSGPGVPAEIVDRIFEPFFTTKEVGQGVGLGLWLAGQVAAHHEGSLTYSERAGGGACFVLELACLR